MTKQKVRGGDIHSQQLLSQTNRHKEQLVVVSVCHALHRLRGISPSMPSHFTYKLQQALTWPTFTIQHLAYHTQELAAYSHFTTVML